MSITFDEFRNALPDARECGDHFVDTCPCCDGVKKLEFKAGDKQAVVCVCHKCRAAFGEIVDKLKLNRGVGGDGARQSFPTGGAGSARSATTAAAKGEKSEKPPKDDLAKNWLWKTPDDASREFETLTLAKNDPGAVKFFKDDYGLDADALPDDWRILDHPYLGSGVVYLGHSPDGSPAYKFKGIARIDEKREKISNLHGPMGKAAIIFEGAPDLPLVICGGEEKGPAARATGCSALAPLFGEKVLPDAWIARLIELNPARIVIANDNDDKGSKANNATARALELAGYSANRIAVVQWPADAPEKYDLNDALKTGGAEAVRELIVSAKTPKPTLPRVMSAADFITANRPPLSWHIQDLLPVGGKMTISATSKFGKSFLAIQMGLALASGDCEWLGLQFGPPARVLYLQAEIMDSLVEARLKVLLQTLPPELDPARAGRNFFAQEINDGRPNLMTEEGRATVEAVIQANRPDVVILDPLAALHPGLEENAADKMGAALGFIQDLALKYRCAVILIHHFSKAKAARGSSVFEAWPESDLQFDFLSDDDHSTAKVLMRLRCAYNDGPTYLRMPTRENLWFERMPEGWMPDKAKGGRSPSASPEAVVVVLEAKGELLHGEFVKVLMATLKVSASTAKRAIEKAREIGLIDKPHMHYSVTEKGSK